MRLEMINQTRLSWRATIPGTGTYKRYSAAAWTALVGNPVPAFTHRQARNAHHPSHCAGAACGGLNPDPAIRVGGTCPHLLCSKAASSWLYITASSSRRHDDHVAGGLPPSPAVGPQVEHVVQVDVGEQRRDHRALSRPLVAYGDDPVLQEPTFSHDWIRRTMRRSSIRCSTKRTNHLWLTSFLPVSPAHSATLRRNGPRGRVDRASVCLPIPDAELIRPSIVVVALSRPSSAWV